MGPDFIARTTGPLQNADEASEYTKKFENSNQHYVPAATLPSCATTMDADAGRPAALCEGVFLQHRIDDGELSAYLKAATSFGSKERQDCRREASL
jgi:hypothetical protein